MRDAPNGIRKGAAIDTTGGGEVVHLYGRCFGLYEHFGDTEGAGDSCTTSLADEANTAFMAFGEGVVQYSNHAYKYNSGPRRGESRVAPYTAVRCAIDASYNERPLWGWREYRL